MYPTRRPQDRVGDGNTALEYVLTVVEDEQHFAGIQMVDDLLHRIPGRLVTDPEGVNNRCRYLGVV
ncbi:Uncharacterised protein [Mycobacteroides abscessus subsp. abscessus]|nr:Uncharacterised protein [Mycobacteroides abscessus subsp. abscessus]